MELLFTFIAGLGAWNWLFAVVALFLLDAVVPGVHFLWFRIAAAAIGVVALCTSISWQWQVVGFVLFSVAAALWVQKHVRPQVIVSDVPNLNAGGTHFLGRAAIVAEDIESGCGKVRVGDSIWPAEGQDAVAGTVVTVLGVRGIALVVGQRP